MSFALCCSAIIHCSKPEPPALGTGGKVTGFPNTAHHIPDAPPDVDASSAQRIRSICACSSFFRLSVHPVNGSSRACFLASSHPSPLSLYWLTNFRICGSHVCTREPLAQFFPVLTIGIVEFAVQTLAHYLPFYIYEHGTLSATRWFVHGGEGRIAEKESTTPKKTKRGRCGRKQETDCGDEHFAARSARKSV